MNLAEALESPEFDRVLEAKLDELVETKGLISSDEADRRVQEAVSAQSRIRDLRDHAKSRITSAKGLGETARRDLLERFGARDSGNGVLEAAVELDVAPQMDGDTVTKSRVQVLDERLDEAFKRERDRVAEAAPSRVSGQGASAPAGELAEGQVHHNGSDWVEAARRAGVDVEKAYGVKAPAATT